MVIKIKKIIAFLLLLLTATNITSAARIICDEEDNEEVVNTSIDVKLTPEEIDLLKFARSGDVESFKKLVETGKVNINCEKQIDCKCCKDEKHSGNCADICHCQYSPLMLAVQFGHIEIVKYLLEQENIDVNYFIEAVEVNDDYGHWQFNAAYLAMEYKNYDILKLILEHKKFNILTPCNKEDDDKYVSAYERFLILIDLGLLDHVKMLVNRLKNKINDEFFMEGDVAGEVEFTLLATCAYYSDEKSLVLLKYLLESNFLNPNKMVNYYRSYDNMHLTTPLIIAARCDGKKKFEFIKLLTSHPDIVLNTKDGEGNTALHWLYHYNNFESIKYLLTLDGIDPETKNSDGLSIEDLAKKDNNEAVLKFLAEYNKNEKKVVKLEVSTNDENADNNTSPKVKKEELDQIDPEISNILKNEISTDVKPFKSISTLIGPAIETINQEEFRSISPSYYLGLVATTFSNNIDTDTPKMLKEEKEKKSEEPEFFGLKKRRIE